MKWVACMLCLLSLLFLLPSISGNGVFRSFTQLIGAEDKASRYLLFSQFIGADTTAPLIQLSFHGLYGNITPTKMDDYFVKNINMNPHPLAVSCTLTSYEATLTAKRDKSTRKTKAKIICGLREVSKVMPEPVCSSIYIVRHVYQIIQEVAQLIGFFQSVSSKSKIKIGGLEIIALNLTNHLRQSWSGEFQMTAALSFSTSPQPYRVLNIAVLVRSTFRQFVNLTHDENLKEPRLQGLSIDVLKAAVALLPYHFAYKLVPFYGSRAQLLEEVARETFDAAAGGIVITAERSPHVEFSQPYAELRMVMVVKEKDNGLNGVFWFMSPFTRGMWIAIVAMTIFTGLVIRFIELRASNGSVDSPSRQVGAAFCFPFAFLFNEYRPTNRLSYFLLVPWSLLVLIVTLVYTANLGSMVTSSQIKPSGLDVASLKRTNAVIGCDGNPFTVSYLVNNLGFERKNVKNTNSIDDYEKALSSGNIKAAFLSIPDTKVFLAKYCGGFTKSGHAYNLGSFGFVFPRYSPLASDISEAILKLKDAGKLQQMEKEKLSSSDCPSDQTVTTKIGPGPFTGLFLVSGSASASAILITVIRVLRRRNESCIQRMLIGRGLWVWLTTSLSQNQRRNELQLSSSTSQNSQTQLSSS